MEANTNTLPTFEEFLAWHADAKSRLQTGEWMAEPDQKMYEHWAPIHAMWARAARATAEAWSNAG